eukprot:sb/3470773/
MDADGVPIIGQKVDLKLLEPLQQKRTLAYINHFVIQMTGLLNNFACRAESGLMEIDRRSRQIETTLLLLEAKLASIPELEGVTAATETTQPTEAPSPNAPPAPPAPVAPPAPTVEQDGDTTVVEETPAQPDFVPVSKDPRYAKYFKMVTVGIPPAALHVKMQMEGLDPVYLDNPDQPAPPMTESNPQSTDSDASSSD